MTPAQRNALIAAALALAGVGVYVTTTGDSAAGEPVVVVHVLPSRSRPAEDGGVEVFRRVIVTTETPGSPMPTQTIEDRVIAPDCVRRPASVDVSACRRVVPEPDGGFSVIDAPPKYRFAADASVGDGCEPVACSVLAGESDE